ncbi:unnamed protein product, partial [marine sediment metagenome]
MKKQKDQKVSLNLIGDKACGIVLLDNIWVFENDMMGKIMVTELNDEFIWLRNETEIMIDGNKIIGFK